VAAELSSLARSRGQTEASQFLPRTTITTIGLQVLDYDNMEPSSRPRAHSWPPATVSYVVFLPAETYRPAPATRFSATNPYLVPTTLRCLFCWQKFTAPPPPPAKIPFDGNVIHRNSSQAKIPITTYAYARFACNSCHVCQKALSRKQEQPTPRQRIQNKAKRSRHTCFIPTVDRVTDDSSDATRLCSWSKERGQP